MGFNKDEAVKKIQDSQSTEFEVFDTAEHTTYLDNYKETVVDKELKSKVKGVHDQYDNDIFKITGRRRSDGEKTYDLLAEVIGDYGGREALTGELTDLKQQIKDGTGDKALKSKVEALEKELENVQELHKGEKKKWDTEKEGIVSSHARASMSNILDRAGIGIKFKEGMADSTMKIVVDAVTNELLEIATVVDGIMVFNDADGNILRNKDTLKPFTPEEMLKGKLKDVIDEGRKIDGTGVTEPTITETEVDGKKVKIVNYSPSATVKNKDNLHEDLATKGFTQGSEEYNLAWAKYSPDYKY